MLNQMTCLWRALKGNVAAEVEGVKHLRPEYKSKEVTTESSKPNTKNTLNLIAGKKVSKEDWNKPLLQANTGKFHPIKKWVESKIVCNAQAQAVRSGWRISYQSARLC